MRNSELPAVLNADRTGYDPTTATYHERHDWDDERTITATVTATVCRVTGDDPMDVDPLYETIDPDALTQALESLRGSEYDPGGAIHFTYNGHGVSVGSDGEICVHCESGDRPDV